MESLRQLKNQLAGALVPAHRVSHQPGLSTGETPLDDFLLWQGLPAGGLSLFHGALGMGATSLWISAAARATQERKWVAWLGDEIPLYPLALQQKGVDLDFLWVVSCNDKEKYFWLLQELLSADLFSLVACDLGNDLFKHRQWQKLSRQIRRSQAATVFLTQSSQWKRNESLFSLIIEFEQHHLTVRRALHRPTPYQVPRRSIHAHLMYQFTESDSFADAFFQRRLFALQLKDRVS